MLPRAERSGLLVGSIEELVVRARKIGLSPDEVRMALETRDLTRQFGVATAVDRVSMRVPFGSVFALIGSNGAGKSTLIRMLMNIVEPNSGSGAVLGQDCRTLTGDGFRRIG